MAIRLNDPLRTIIADRVSSYLSGTGGTSGSAGALRVYGGTQPTDGGGTAGTQEILVRIDGIAWSAGSNGTTAIVATKTGTAGTSGTASWARLSGTNGTAYIIDGSCSTSATADFVLDVMVITFEEVVTLTAATIVQPGS